MLNKDIEARSDYPKDAPLFHSLVYLLCYLQFFFQFLEDLAPVIVTNVSGCPGSGYWLDKLVSHFQGIISIEGFDGECGS